MDSKLRSLGPVVDVDSHEMIPVYLWAENFGEEIMDRIAPITPGMVAQFGAETIGPVSPPDEVVQASAAAGGLAAAADAELVEPDSIWELKGPTAPGAADMLRRTEILDAMGIDRQLVFPSFALIGVVMATNDSAPEILGFDRNSGFDYRAAGRAMIAAQNRWAGTTSEKAGGRARMVALIHADTVPEMIAELHESIAYGAKAVWIPTNPPPGGCSPAHRDLDPFWATCAEADIPVLLHIGTEGGLISSTWHEGVPEFAWTFDSLEFPLEPYRASIVNLSCENFLGAMVLGAVFERHPTLRFGVIECGAFWFGPLAEKLDLWAKVFHRRMANTLSMKPSAYLERNVRVTPYVFEPIAQYYERYPQVADSYCFSTDYPHVEGGEHSKRVFFDQLAGFGDDVLRQFFVTNGALLLPAD